MLTSVLPLSIFAATAVANVPERMSVWAAISGGIVSLLIAGISAAVIGKRLTRGIRPLSPFGRTLGPGPLLRHGRIEHRGGREGKGRDG